MENTKTPAWESFDREVWIIRVSASKALPL
jgi:hypothetical protein